MTSDTNNTYIWEATNEELIAELGRRGYAAYEDESYNVAPLERMDHTAIADYLRDEAGYIVEERTRPDQSERNTVPEEKWLEIFGAGAKEGGARRDNPQRG